MLRHDLNLSVQRSWLPDGIDADRDSRRHESRSPYSKAIWWRLASGGIVAAAAIYALENNIDRLADDHRNAKTLAHGLAAMDGIRCNPDEVESNLVFFEVDATLGTAVQLSSALKPLGIAIGPMGGQRLRAVTHLDVDAADMPVVLKAIQSCLSKGFKDAVATGSGPYSK